MHHTRVLLSYDIYIKPYFKLYNCAGQHRTTEYDTYYRHRPRVNFTQVYERSFVEVLVRSVTQGRTS